MSDTKNECNTCHGAGVVTCSNCGGKKEFECSNCHGKGHLDSCSDCGSTGKVTCSTCGGTGKIGVDCPVCDHGKVTKTRLRNCEYCHGTGKRQLANICEDCDEYIDDIDKPYCPSCGSSRLRPRIIKCCLCHDGSGQVEEKYQDICPNCHGDYKGYKGEKACDSCGGTGKRTCSSCNGSGKKKCEKCGGSGNVECSQCHGAGSVKCPECKKREEEAAAAKAKREAADRKRREEAAAAEKRRRQKAEAAERERTRESYQNRGTFMLLGMSFGLLGVHYAYIHRWFMFLVQIVLTGCGVAQCFIPSINEQIQNLMMPYSIKLNESSLPWLGLAIQYPILIAAVVWCLFGVILIGKDGTRHKMKFAYLRPEGSRGWFISASIVLPFITFVIVNGIASEGYHKFETIGGLILLASLLIPFIYARVWRTFFLNLLILLPLMFMPHNSEGRYIILPFASITWLVEIVLVACKY